MGTIICFIACVVMFLIYAGVGLYLWRSKKPANFWTGEKIPAGVVSDVKKYNRANGIMWIVFGVLYLIPAFTTFASVLISGVIIGVLTFIGTPVLIIIYTKKIKPKYISKNY